MNSQEITYSELVHKIQEILPDALVSEQSGEIVIATGLRETTPGEVLTPVDALDGAVVSSAHYFTDDGTYGSVDGMEIIDTTNWTEEDWGDIEESSDLARLETARVIAKARKLVKAVAEKTVEVVAEATESEN